MGHSINYLRVSKKEEILPRCEEYAFVNTDREENHFGSYHGNLHIREDVSIQDDYETACKKINEIVGEKSYYDVAVRYYDTNKAKKTKKIETLEQRISNLLDKKSEYIKEHSVTLQQATLIGCKNCGSKIAKKFLHSEFCPVCRKDLRSETVIKRITKFDEDCKSLRQTIAEEKRKKKTECPVMWAVKVEVHC